jgi:hypothetical protein
MWENGDAAKKYLYDTSDSRDSGHGEIVNADSYTKSLLDISTPKNTSHFERQHSEKCNFTKQDIQSTCHSRISIVRNAIMATTGTKCACNQVYLLRIVINRTCKSGLTQTKLNGSIIIIERKVLLPEYISIQLDR